MAQYNSDKITTCWKRLSPARVGCGIIINHFLTELGHQSVENGAGFNAGWHARRKQLVHYTLCTCLCLQQPTKHTHPSNGPFFGTTQVSRYQKGRTNLNFTGEETVSGSGISRAICKSAPCSRQITTPAPHHSVLSQVV